MMIISHLYAITPLSEPCCWGAGPPSYTHLCLSHVVEVLVPLLTLELLVPVTVEHLGLGVAGDNQDHIARAAVLQLLDLVTARGKQTQGHFSWHNYNSYWQWVPYQMFFYLLQNRPIPFWKTQFKLCKFSEKLPWLKYTSILVSKHGILA